MFEILKALLAVQEACRKHGTVLGWYIDHDEAEYPVLRAEISLDPEDEQFANDMKRMFAPVEA